MLQDIARKAPYPQKNGFSQTRSNFEDMQKSDEYDNMNTNANFTKINWRSNYTNEYQEPSQTSIKRRYSKRNISMQAPFPNSNTSMNENLPRILEDNSPLISKKKNHQLKVGSESKYQSDMAQIKKDYSQQQNRDERFNSLNYNREQNRNQYQDLEDRIQTIIFENRQQSNNFVKIRDQNINKMMNNTYYFHNGGSYQSNLTGFQQAQSQNERQQRFFNQPNNEEMQKQQIHKPSPRQSRDLGHYKMDSRKRIKVQKPTANDLFVINLQNTSKQFIEDQEEQISMNLKPSHDYQHFQQHRHNQSFKIGKQESIFQPMYQENPLNETVNQQFQTINKRRHHGKHQSDSFTSVQQFNSGQYNSNIECLMKKWNPTQKNSRQQLEKASKYNTGQVSLKNNNTIKPKHEPLQLARTINNHRHLERKIFNQDEWLYKQIKDIFTIQDPQQQNYGYFQNDDY